MRTVNVKTEFFTLFSSYAKTEVITAEGIIHNKPTRGSALSAFLCSVGKKLDKTRYFWAFSEATHAFERPLTRFHRVS